MPRPAPPQTFSSASTEVNRLLQSAEMQERLRKLDNMAYP
jgi:hypothetical protein